MKATLIFAWTGLKRSFRDPISLFFMILFPLIFLFVFGTIFGNSDQVSLPVAVFDQAKTDFSKQFVDELNKNEVFDIVSDVTDLNQAKEKVSRGELGSIIELSAGFGEIKALSPDVQCDTLVAGIGCLPSGKIIVHYDVEGSPEVGQLVVNIMNGIVSDINGQLASTPAPLTVETKSTTRASLSQFDYTFAGLLAFTLMSMGLYVLPTSLPGDKKNGVLRRVKATPFKPRQLIIGTVLSYLVMSLVSITIMITVSVLAFGLDMRGNWLILALFSLISISMFCGIGMIIAGWTKSDSQAAMLSQVVATPMMFLGGAFFPRLLMPDWLQNITTWVPMSSVVDGVRYIVAENASLVTLLPQIGFLVACGLVAYVVAFKVFRWE
jgi:ABC-2 type transport system permease protein